MDAKLSCLLKGSIGLIFGGLALVVPGPVLSLFLGIFWVLLIAGIVLCLFIGITSHAEDSFFWFFCSAVLLVIGIVSILFQNLIALLFVLAIGVLAFYAAYSGISLALTRPRSKHFLVAGVIVSSLVLLGFFIHYVPSMSETLAMTVVGTFSFVFGLFAILMGVSMKEGAAAPIPPHVLIFKTCGITVKSAGTEAPSAGIPDQSCEKPDEKPPQ
ncbi:MAG: hypothetical protein ABR999_01360 [Methanoregula sp.]|jgi:uncharacterized membrane protein HdeD (DUF308 family)|uniref:hypothetical protein n=1 Tax=Methanoregula sp. TaxID=2052170 RepID=UPI003D0C9136